MRYTLVQIQQTLDFPVCVIGRPDPKVEEANRLIVALAIGDSSDHSNARRWALANELLKIDNGPWSDTRHIKHYCRGMFCCKNGIKETRMKLLSAIYVAVLHKPTTFSSCGYMLLHVVSCCN